MPEVIVTLSDQDFDSLKKFGRITFIWPELMMAIVVLPEDKIIELEQLPNVVSIERERIGSFLG